ncbi:hypothetical protein TYRP_012997 [Tyrophagus putrescentiae]|nr:hypothetical protein TYRP_012997 [Tyrophagus putrescentiae]
MAKPVALAKSWFVHRGRTSPLPEVAFISMGLLLPDEADEDEPDEELPPPIEMPPPMAPPRPREPPADIP